jgi:hypothetical protein
MPFDPSDATRHTKKATTAKKRRTFSKTANAVLERTGDEGKAIRIANAQVAKGHRRPRSQLGNV